MFIDIKPVSQLTAVGGWDTLQRENVTIKNSSLGIFFLLLTEQHSMRIIFFLFFFFKGVLNCDTQVSANSGIWAVLKEISGPQKPATDWGEVWIYCRRFFSLFLEATSTPSTPAAQLQWKRKIPAAPCRVKLRRARPADVMGKLQ